ncbi:MAG TPA: hypothetical protein VFS24_00995 [Steroidobacteraceae bacterium]|nr:hypothetical protein [Steroidobacteraceae bacterium]
MKRTIIIALAASTLIGCTTVRDFTHEHPAVTAFSAALVVGSIAASHGSSRSDSHDMHIPAAPDCANNPAMCR